MQAPAATAAAADPPTARFIPAPDFAAKDVRSQANREAGGGGSGDESYVAAIPEEAEGAAPNVAATEDAAPADAAPADAASEDAAPQDAASEVAAPQDAASEDATSELAASELAAPEP